MNLVESNTIPDREEEKTPNHKAKQHPRSRCYTPYGALVGISNLHRLT